MKLAVFAGTVADGTLQGAIQYCKDLEVDRLVVGPGHVPGFRERGYFDTVALQKVKQEIEDAGLSFSVMQLWPPMVPGASETEARLSGICKCMEAMGEVGVNVLSIFVGTDQSVDESARWGLVVDFYKKLMAQAEKCGVKVALHTGGRQWNSEALDRLMQDVPSPCNGVNLCPGNSWVPEGEGIYDVIRRLGKKVFFVHLRNVRQIPGDPHVAEVWFGTGEPDISKILHALRDIDYRGDMMSEHLPQVVGENRQDIRTAYAIGYMKALLQSV
jgi:sugar phosphate isomerase/epimerase